MEGQESFKEEKNDDKNKGIAMQMNGPMNNRSFSEMLNDYNHNNNSNNTRSKVEEENVKKSQDEPTMKQPMKRKHPQKAVDISKMGQWEKHTKGFGMKMLQKMGFKGRLGRDEQGVSAPVAAKARPAGLGLGYGDFKEVTKLNKHIEEDLHGITSPERVVKKDDSQEFVVEKLWKAKDKTKRKKRVYKTAQELIQNNTTKENNDLIVDMRGKDIKYHTSMDSINSQVEDTETKFGQELIYNVHLVVNQAEMKVQEVNSRINTSKQKLANMNYDRTQLISCSKSEVERINNLKTILSRVANLKTIKNKSLEEVLEEVCFLKTKFPTEYRAYKLSNLVLALAMPLLNESLRDWDPLYGENEKIFRQIQSLKDILTTGLYCEDDDDESFLVQNTKDSYAEESFYHIIETLVMPPIRSRIINEWNVKQPHSCIVLVSHLQTIVSKSSLENTLHHVIFPKLRGEVDAWDPRGDSVHIHTWILPWIPFLKENLFTLYPKIRHAIGMLLPAWHPMDQSAHTVIFPWKEVWDANSMDSLLSRCVLPKLRLCLKTDLKIHPGNQIIDPFRWVMSWENLFRKNRFVALLEEEFFPMWLDILEKWLKHEDADYEEIVKWYLGWKMEFSKEAFNTPEIRGQFLKALQIMNSTMEDLCKAN